jgi:hypothetical protein
MAHAASAWRMATDLMLPSCRNTAALPSNTGTMPHLFHSRSQSTLCLSPSLALATTALLREGLRGLLSSPACIKGNKILVRHIKFGRLASNCRLMHSRLMTAGSYNMQTRQSSTRGTLTEAGPARRLLQVLEAFCRALILLMASAGNQHDATAGAESSFPAFSWQV